MLRRFLVAAGFITALALAGDTPSRLTSANASFGFVPVELTPAELMAFAHENGCLLPEADADAADAALMPARTIKDAYPNFLGIAVDPENGRVAMSDSGLKGLLMYDRAAGTSPGVDQVTKALAELRGSETDIGFVAGVALDPVRKEKYTVNNDGSDSVVVFDYDATGNRTPKRSFMVAHQAWGVALDRKRDELAVTVEINNWIEFYRRDSTGKPKPTRLIRGDTAGLADPHGIVLDAMHDELLVANHGNWTSLTSFDAHAQPAGTAKGAVGGRFLPPSIRVFAAAAQGEVAPLRVIEGGRTGLNWPMSLDVDAKNDEIAVANSGDNRVLIFRRSDRGNVAPIRAIGGGRTGLSGPMGVAIDNRNDEIWVTNYSDHSAVVFARTASGNVAPKRVIRNAPIGAPSVGFGNPGAIAYDSKRDEILVPN
jgi:DNA-binding beta-propeller fold protein YncE